MDVISTSVIASISLLICLASAASVCSYCRRIFRRKKRSKTKDEESGKVSDVKEENGIKNPAYEPAAAKEDEETKIDVGNTKPEVTSECESEDKKQEESKLTIIREIGGDTAAEKRGSSSLPTSPTFNSEQEVKAEMPTNGSVRHSVGKEDSFPAAALKNKNPPLPKHVEESTIVMSQSQELKQSPVNNDVRKVSTVSDSTQSKRYYRQTLASPKVFSDDIEDPDWDKYDGETIQGGWRMDVKLTDLLLLGIIDADKADKIAAEHGDKPKILESLKPYLVGENPIAGVIVTESGEKKSIFKSAKEGILRRGTAISLLEAQAATGNVIDPINGLKMSVAEGYRQGLLDKVYETVLSRAERAVTGYKSRITKESMPLGQAMERGLVVESHGMRLLEAQLATGGIIDHEVNLKLPIDLALKRKLLSGKVAKKLVQTCNDVDDVDKADEFKTFFDPNTEENVTYRELMRRCVVDSDTGLRLYPLEKTGRKRYSYSSFSGRSSLVSSRSGSTEDITIAVASE